MQRPRFLRTPPGDMTRLILTSASAALLTGLLSFPILMTSPVMAEQPAADSERPETPVPARLPLPGELRPDDLRQPPRDCTCEMALALAD